MEESCERNGGQIEVVFNRRSRRRQCSSSSAIPADPPVSSIYPLPLSHFHTTTPALCESSAHTRKLNSLVFFSVETKKTFKKQKKRQQRQQQRDPRSSGPIPQPPQPPTTLDARFAQASAAAEAVAEGRPPPPSDDDFERRLARLAREAAAKKAAAEGEKASSRGSVLDSGVPDYDSPPPLSRTIASAMTGGSSSGSDSSANSKEGKISNGSLTAAASALLLAAVFVFTSGGFGGGGGGEDDGIERIQRISSASSSLRQRKLSDAERAEVRSQLEKYEATLATPPPPWEGPRL